MTLVVDLRRAFDSGLGTYIREVVPRVLAQCAGTRLLGVVAEGDDSRHRAYLGSVSIELRASRAKPLTLAEQWSLRAVVPPGAVFWATTLAHPLFTRSRLMASVHDVLQLALPHPAGASGLSRLASRLIVESLRRRANLLLFNSAFTQSEFSRCAGRSKGMQRVTPLGVDRAVWTPQQPQCSAPSTPSSVANPSARNSTPYFLYVGNLRAHKNLALLVDAMLGLGGALPHALWLVGRTQGFRSNDHALLSRIDTAGPRVRHLGELEPAALRECVRHAAALVIPSVYEGFGLPVLEAMASGCPVIASSAASLPEVGGGAAMYFDPFDMADLQRCLLHAASMPADERAAWVQRGLDHVQGHSWDRTAELTVQAMRVARLVNTLVH